MKTNISFRKLNNNQTDNLLLYHWYQNKNVYEWFEQRKLSLKEIKDKYQKKLDSHEQELLIIQFNNQDIGLVQIYKFIDDINISNLKKYHNIYEFDLFIGEEEYLSKGIGSQVVRLVNEMIYYKYNADAIILRPFKRNIRAINCYLKCDFKVIEDYCDNDTIGNKEITEVLINEKH